MVRVQRYAFLLRSRNVQQPWQLFPSALLSGAGWAARAGSGRLHFSHRVAASFWSSQWSGRKGSFFPDPTSAAMSKPHSKGSPPYTLARKSIAQQSSGSVSREALMFGSLPHWQHAAALIGALSLGIAGCTTRTLGTSEAPPPSPPPAVASLPPAFPPEEIVGRWGFASYHKEGDRPRTEKAATAQCGKPYVINRGATGEEQVHLRAGLDAHGSEGRGAHRTRPQICADGGAARAQGR